MVDKTSLMLNLVRSSPTSQPTPLPTNTPMIIVIIHPINNPWGKNTKITYVAIFAEINICPGIPMLNIFPLKPIDDESDEAAIATTKIIKLAIAPLPWKGEVKITDIILKWSLPMASKRTKTRMKPVKIADKLCIKFL